MKDVTPLRMLLNEQKVQTLQSSAQSSDADLKLSVSNWISIAAGQTVNYIHGLKRIPNLVLLEFSVDGKTIGGSCVFQVIGGVACGCCVVFKDDKQLIIQAGKTDVGFTVDNTGFYKVQTAGYFRVVAW